MKNALFLLALILSEVLYAQTAKDLLTKDLVKSYRILDKETYFYSYFPAPTETGQDGYPKIHSYLQKADTRQQWSTNLLSTRAGDFWDLNNHSTYRQNAGAGMYFAVDPSSTTEFGDTAIVIRVAQGTTILNLFKPAQLSNETKKALITEKYITPEQLMVSDNSLSLSEGMSGTTLRNMVLQQNEKFRTLVQSIFSEQKIQLIQYAYRSHLKGLCKVASSSSFVLIGLGEKEKDVNGHSLALIETNSISPLALYSKMTIENLTLEEQSLLDLIRKFHRGLAETKQQGSANSKQIMRNNMSEEEINQMVSKTFLCERAW